MPSPNKQLMDLFMQRSNSIKKYVVGFWLLLLSMNLASGQSNSRADLYVQLADGFRNHTLPDSAVIYYKKAAEEFKTLGETEKLINAYNQIGIILTRQDRYEEARMYLGMAEIQGNSLPDTNHLLRASTFITLGVVYSSMGDYKGSLAYHHRALAIRLLKLGEYHADVATCYGNIGNVNLNKKDYATAIEAHLKAKEIREKLFGENSAEVAQSYYNLGIAYRETKEYETSLDYFQKALRNKITQLGEGHKDLARYYTAVSGVYYLMDNKEQGDIYKTKADEALREQ